MVEVTISARIPGSIYNSKLDMDTIFLFGLLVPLFLVKAPHKLVFFGDEDD